MAKRKKNTSGLVPFKKGSDERRNVTGLNKGSKWRKNLLKELATIPLEKVENKVFKTMMERFPELFDGNETYNWQLFMEVKQLSLIHHKDPKVSQAAIKEVKDRIDGKSIQRIAETDSDGNDIKKEPETMEEIEAEIQRLEKELNGKGK